MDIDNSESRRTYNYGLWYYDAGEWERIFHPVAGGFVIAPENFMRRMKWFHNHPLKEFGDTQDASIYLAVYAVKRGLRAGTVSLRSSDSRAADRHENALYAVAFNGAERWESPSWSR